MDLLISKYETMLEKDERKKTNFEEEIEDLENELDSDKQTAGDIMAGQLSIEDGSWGSFPDYAPTKLSPKPTAGSHHDEIEEEIREGKMDEEDSYSDDEFGITDSEKERQEAAQTKQLLDDAIEDEVDELFNQTEPVTAQARSDT